jgi:hypothetical protein
MKKHFTVFTIVSFLSFILLVSLSHALEAIQTQPSSDGRLEASLIGADIKRSVLTVKVSLENTSTDRIEPEFAYESVYFADVEAQKKYFALKDENGLYIAGPRHSEWHGGSFKQHMNPGDKMIIWVKFPAPPESTTVIDIFFPGILPSEEVELKR